MLIIQYTRCEVTHTHVTSLINMWRHSYSFLYDVTYLTTSLYMFTPKSCETSQTRQNCRISSSKSIFDNLKSKSNLMLWNQNLLWCFEIKIYFGDSKSIFTLTTWNWKGTRSERGRWWWSSFLRWSCWASASSAAAEQTMTHWWRQRRPWVRAQLCSRLPLLSPIWESVWGTGFYKHCYNNIIKMSQSTDVPVRLLDIMQTHILSPIKLSYKILVPRSLFWRSFLLITAYTCINLSNVYAPKMMFYSRSIKVFSPFKH